MNPMLAPVMADALVAPEGLRLPPTEFRIFRQGVNFTTKGSFLFDEQAAAMVMAAYKVRGLDLTIDYEHQALVVPPVVAPAAATRWVPQIRNGELWATDVKWTDRAWGHLAAGEYRYFSPAFRHAKSQEGEPARVEEIINIALTNLPAMDGIDALVAASARAMDATRAQETGMEELQKQIAELSAKVAELTEQLSARGAELSARDAQIAELTAQLSSKDSDAEKKAKEKEAEEEEKKKAEGEQLSQLTALRTHVLAVTGQTSDAAAIGALTALKGAQADISKLSARVAELEGEKLCSELDALLSKGETEGKLPPAKREEIKTVALNLGGGKVTRAGVDAAKACLSLLAPAVFTTVVAPGKPAERGAEELHPIQVAIARTCGRDPAELKRAK